ncbi:MAG: hypothetical protein KC589_04840 [Nanoarchaeota archaeon]|nr:hypothetical protein [Nanoarchaeota archaeon]
MDEKILLITTHDQKLNILENEFVNPIVNIIKNHNNSNNYKYIILHYSKINNNLLKKYSKIIICGTALKDEKYLKDINKFLWIKETNQHILGICAGSQIIAKIFNAQIIKKSEIGIYKPKIIKNDPILYNENLNEIYSLHNNSLKIDNTKNNVFEIIAKTQITPQIFKIKNHFIYGILFHPEIKNKNIINNFLNL